MINRTGDSRASSSIDRRAFVVAASVGFYCTGVSQSSLLSAAQGAQDADASGRYQQLDSDRHLGSLEKVAEVADAKPFTEGPAVAPDGAVYFTNVPAEKIYRFDPALKRLELYRDKSNKANGLLFDGRGRLLACEGGAGRVTRTNLATGKIDVLADEYDGKPLAAPNDLVLTRGGHLFFSSRPATEKSNPNAVYRRDPDGSLHQVLTAPNIHMPNGMAVSPDNQTYYLIEAHPDAEHRRDILAFALSADGALSKRRVLIDFYPGRSGDGMCVNAKGQLLVAAGLHARRGTSETLATKPGLHLFSPSGKLLAYRQTPEDTVTNCAVDDKRGWIYITCRGSLYRVPMKT